MASLTDPRVTQYSTVSSIDVDLASAEEAFAAVQIELEQLLESGKATMALVAECEGRLEKAQHERDELRGTRQFLIDRQRWQSEKDAAGLLYTIVLCKWNSTPPTSQEDERGSFTAANVTEYTFNLQTANEMNGVTGAIYILRGWFAMYLEGPPAVINRLCSEMKADRRKFELVVIAEKDSIKVSTAASDAASVRRRFPNESLRIVHVEDAQSSLDKHPESTVLREVAQMMNLFAFVPDFNEANRGKDRFEAKKGCNMSLMNDPHSSQPPEGTMPSRGVIMKPPAPHHNTPAGAIFPSASRVVVLISPFGDFWDMGLLPSDVSRIINSVYEKARSFLVDRTQRSFAAGLCGPHTQDGLYVVVQSNNTPYVLDVLTDFLSELNKDLEISELYKPVMVVEHSSEVGLIVNGSCTVVGPIMRQLRKLLTVARQEAVPFLLSYRVADLADRSGCHSVGVFVIDRDPSELFTHVRLLGKVGLYASESLMAADKDRAAMLLVDTHVEGPGEIEPCGKLGLREATAKEKNELMLNNASKQREVAFEKRANRAAEVPTGVTLSSFSTGTMDAPRPPANLSSTRAVIAAFDDPSKNAALKSIQELTTTFKGQAVMKDDAAVRPAGSAMHAVRSVTAASAANNPLLTDPKTRYAAAVHEAARHVQMPAYFTPKGIGGDGDAELRAVYDALPQDYTGSDRSTLRVTRKGFELYYNSLEHYGTQPTPTVIDELLGGKVSDPRFVSFEQFCMVMHKYQRM